MGRKVLCWVLTVRRLSKIMKCLTKASSWNLKTAALLAPSIWCGLTYANSPVMTHSIGKDQPEEVPMPRLLTAIDCQLLLWGRKSHGWSKWQAVETSKIWIRALQGRVLPCWLSMMSYMCAHMRQPIGSFLQILPESCPDAVLGYY